MENEGKMTEFKYERQAMAGEEMPDGLRFSDQHCYLSLRMLYQQYRNCVIDRETARNEKRKILNTYEYDLMWENIADGFIKNRDNSELARAEYRKNHCHENAVKIIESIEGVKWQGERLEA